MLLDEGRKTLAKRLPREAEDERTLMAIELMTAVSERCPSAFNELMRLAENPDFVCEPLDELPVELIREAIAWARKHHLKSIWIVYAAAEWIAYGSPGVPAHALGLSLDQRHTFQIQFHPFLETPREFERRAKHFAAQTMKSLKAQGLTPRVFARNRLGCDYLVEQRVNGRTLDDLAAGRVPGLGPANEKGIEARMNRVRTVLKLSPLPGGRPQNVPD